MTRAQELAAELNKMLGSDTIKFGSDPYFVVTYLPTGVMPVDHLLEGGIPYGRIVEFFGDFSTLKTYVALKAIAQCQAAGGVAALFDSEKSFDPLWAEQCGVNVKELLLKQPQSIEAAIDATEVLLRGHASLVVFDSVAAMLPQSERAQPMEGKSVQPARLAAAMSLGLRKLTAANSKTAMIFINQTRMNIGVMFGNPEVTTGGKALGFYASMRISFKKAGWTTEEKECLVFEGGKLIKKKVKQRVAVTIKANVEKSKLNVPHREVYFTYDFKDAEVNNWQYLANMCVENGLMKTDRGYWWTGKETKQRLLTFRGLHPESKLMAMLVEKNLLPGSLNPDKSGGGHTNGKPLKNAVPGRIRIREQGKSSTTGPTKKPSTRLRTVKKPTS